MMAKVLHSDAAILSWGLHTFYTGILCSLAIAKKRDENHWLLRLNDAILWDLIWQSRNMKKTGVI